MHNHVMLHLKLIHQQVTKSQVLYSKAENYVNPTYKRKLYLPSPKLQINIIIIFYILNNEQFINI
jgi:hypothetical protein